MSPCEHHDSMMQRGTLFWILGTLIPIALLAFGVMWDAKAGSERVDAIAARVDRNDDGIDRLGNEVRYLREESAKQTIILRQVEAYMKPGKQ